VPKRQSVNPAAPGMVEQIARNQAPQTPDPSILATQQVLREVALLREVFDTRIDGMDKAIVLLQKETDLFPELRKELIAHLQALHNERFETITTLIKALEKQSDVRFESIAQQFRDLVMRTQEKAGDVKVAVDAAFSAAKEAVGEQNKSNAASITKSELGFTKQIDQIGMLVAAQAKGLDDKIADLKDRMTQIESRKRGAGELWGLIVGALGLLGVVITVIVMLARTA
jgi:hypothetical protein